MVKYLGVDISHWQGDVNFQELKKDDVEFVILKAGGSDYGFYTDAWFEENYKRAKAAGLKVGAYYFLGKLISQEQQAEEEARFFINILKGKQFEYPVFIDVETLDCRFKERNTRVVKRFCEVMESHGYFTGIYSSDILGFKNMLDVKELERFCLWVARWGGSPEYVKNYGLWQYSSKGRKKGVSGNIDLDMSFYDYAKVIKSKGFNGFKKEETKRKKKTEETK